MAQPEQPLQDQPAPAPRLGQAETAGISREDVALLACRTLAAYCLIQSLPLLESVASLPTILYSEGTAGRGLGLLLLVGLLPGATYAAMGILLWARSPFFARLLLPRPGATTQSPAPPLGVSDLHAMALCVVGVVFVVLGLPQLVTALVQRGDTDEVDMTRFVRPGVTVALGLALLLTGPVLARICRRPRGPLIP